MAGKLPNEMIAKIVDSYIKLGRSSDCHERLPLTPLAMLNRQWLANVEPILWASIKIDAKELGLFKKMFLRVSRRGSLTRLSISSKDHLNTEFQLQYDNDSGDSGDSGDSDESGSEDDFNEYYEDNRWHRWDDGNVAENYDDLGERAKSLEDEMRHFHQELHGFWEELSGWGPDLILKELIVVTYGDCSLFDHLGRGFRAASAVQGHLAIDQWLEDLPTMPYLPTVLSLKSKSNLDGLWLAIMISKLARTLPHIERFYMEANDSEKSWYYLRKYMREVLAGQLAILPSSIQDVQLNMDFYSNQNQSAPVPLFLHDNVDLLSRSFHTLSLHLTKIVLNVAYISCDILWPSSTGSATFQNPKWPNLETFYVVTGIENAEGGYWTRPSDTNLFHFEYRDDTGGRTSPFEWDEVERLERIFGDRPICYSRDRPDPTQFDKLAISIARAISCMPKLRHFTFEFIADQSFDERGEYKGWAFYFRSGDEENALDWLCDLSFYEGAAIDWQKSRSARSEWVFQCPYAQVQWEEPEGAKALWNARFPNIDRYLVTYEGVLSFDPNGRVWKRWKDGVYVGLAKKLRLK